MTNSIIINRITLYQTAKKPYHIRSKDTHGKRQTKQIIVLCNCNNQNITRKNELAKSGDNERENTDIDISVAPEYVAAEPAETFSVNADTAQMTSLIIGAVYANEDIFEFSSNASDVLEKIRDQLLTDIDALGGAKQLKIKNVSKNDNNGLKTRALVLTWQVIFHISNSISMIGQFVLVILHIIILNTHNIKCKTCTLLSRTCSLS